MEPGKETTIGDRRMQTVCLLIITFVVSAAALHWLKEVLVPFTLAVFFLFAVSPLMDFQMNRLRLPRALAVVGTLLCCSLVLVLLGMLISSSVSEMSSKSDLYKQKLFDLQKRVSEVVPLERVGIDDEEFPSQVATAVGDVVLGLMSAIGTLLQKGIVVLIFLLFLLGGYRPGTATGVWGEVEGSVKKYLGTKFLVSAITGILVGVSLRLLEVDLALVFGVFAFVLNFIPNVGSIISTLLPLPVVIFGPAPVAVAAIAIPGAIQFTIGNVIEPRIMGTSLDLQPIVILVALIFWSVLWGPVGMLLAAPITAILKILFERFELTAPIARVMSGHS